MSEEQKSTMTLIAAYAFYDVNTNEYVGPIGIQGRNVCKFTIDKPHDVDLREFAEVAVRANIARIAREKYPAAVLRFTIQAFSFSVDWPFASEKPILPWGDQDALRRMQNLLFSPTDQWAAALILIHHRLEELSKISEDRLTTPPSRNNQ